MCLPKQIQLQLGKQQVVLQGDKVNNWARTQETCNPGSVFIRCITGAGCPASAASDILF